MIMIDSSFLIAYNNVKDKNHERASELMPKIVSGEFGEVSVTDYVFDETATYIAAKQGLSKAIIVCANILQANELIGVTKEVFDGAWELFRHQRNTNMSFTDCTNVISMRANRIEYIASFDGDFRSLKDIEVVS